MTNFNADFNVNKVLADAADDGNRPLEYSIDRVIRRGQRRVLVRHSAGVAASVLAVGAVVVGATQVAGGNGQAGLDQAPVAGSEQAESSPVRTTVSPSARRGTVVAQPPVARMTDGEIIRRCQVLDREFVGTSSNKAGGGTGSIDDWSVVLKQAPQRWVQALLVSPDGRQFAYCRIDTNGKFREEYLREAVETKPDYRVSTGGIDGAAGKLPRNVARLTFVTPDGVVSEARIANGFFLWFNGQPYTVKPIWAAFYDAAGKELARFNANPAPDRPTPR